MKLSQIDMVKWRSQYSWFLDKERALPQIYHDSCLFQPSESLSTVLTWNSASQGRMTEWEYENVVYWRKRVATSCKTFLRPCRSDVILTYLVARTTCQVTLKGLSAMRKPSCSGLCLLSPFSVARGGVQCREYFQLSKGIGSLVNPWHHKWVWQGRVVQFVVIDSETWWTLDVNEVCN